LRFGEGGIPPGGRGEGGTHFCPYCEHFKWVSAEKNGSIPGPKSHFLQKEAATRVGIAAFLFLRLISVYALEGYWTARVREGFESLVTCEFRFGKVVQSGIYSDGEIAKPVAG
jgi:hypothetical protein